MKNDLQADAVLRKTATPLRIKNAPFGAFFVCFERFRGGLRSKMVRIGRFWKVGVGGHIATCATPSTYLPYTGHAYFYTYLCCL